MNKVSYIEREFIYKKAINNYGKRAQMLMVVEEMSELTKAICKLFRASWCSTPPQENVDAIAEECADVTIMLEQLRIMLDINDAVCENMDKKIERLKERLEKVNHDRRI